MLISILSGILSSLVYFALHPTNTGSFPLPLSPKEEQELLLKMEAGDNEARTKLIEHNLRLVAHVAKKYTGGATDQDDLISIGTIGLIKAISSFNCHKGIRLATYAARCIENEILMYLRKTAQLKNEISLDDPLNVDWDGNELLLSDLLGSDPDIVNRGIEQESEKQTLLRAVEKLDPREKQIMELRFGLNRQKEHTQKEVADALGISQSYISRLEKRILHRLKAEMEKAG